MNPIITIELPAYGMTVLLGILLAVLVYSRRLKQYEYNWRILTVVAVIELVGMAVGAKLLFFLTQLPHVIEKFSIVHTVNVFIYSGFVFYGGLIGAVASSELAARLIDIDGRKLRSFLAPGFAIFHSAGRIGCFLGGCCYGIPWEYGIPMAAEPDVPRVPVQLFECAGELVIFIILILVEHSKMKEYFLMRIYLFCYSVMRFCLEFLRGDSIRGIWFGGLSTSQIISVCIFAVCVVQGIVEFNKMHKDSVSVQ